MQRAPSCHDATAVAALFFIMLVGMTSAACASGPNCGCYSCPVEVRLPADCYCHCPPSCVTPRPIDELWTINTRCLGCPAYEDAANPDVRFERYQHGSGWVAASTKEFFADPQLEMPVVFYIGGNRQTHGDVIWRGLAVYHQVVHGPQEAPPVRFVMLSWPSEQTQRFVRDVREKALRTDTDAYYLAWVLSRMPAEQRMSILGYSLGARIASGAMHILAGGVLTGTPLPEATGPRVHPRIVMWASGMHNYWLSPGEYHGLTLNQVDFVLNLYNGCDPVLQRYRFITKCGSPAALGYTGIARTYDLGPGCQKYRQANICCQVGKTHDVAAYYCSGSVMQATREQLLWTDEMAPDVESDPASDAAEEKEEYLPLTTASAK